MTVPTMLAVFCLASVAAVTDTGSTISAGNVDETTRLMADSDIKSAFLAALRSKPCGDGMVDAFCNLVTSYASFILAYRTIRKSNFYHISFIYIPLKMSCKDNYKMLK